MWYICTVDYYSAFKKKEILTYGIPWMNPENIMLSEVSQSQKTQILYDSTYMRYLRVVKIIETESRMVVAKG